MLNDPVETDNEQLERLIYDLVNSERGDVEAEYRYRKQWTDTYLACAEGSTVSLATIKAENAAIDAKRSYERNKIASEVIRYRIKYVLGKR